MLPDRYHFLRTTADTYKPDSKQLDITTIKVNYNPKRTKRVNDHKKNADNNNRKGSSMKCIRTYELFKQAWLITNQLLHQRPKNSNTNMSSEAFRQTFGKHVFRRPIQFPTKHPKIRNIESINL